MKKQEVRALLIPAVLLVVLVGAYVGYRALSPKVRPQTVPLAGSAENGTQAAGTESAGQAADFTVLNTDGEEVTLSSFFGKPVVVNFWATWCPPCVSEMENFSDAAAEYGDEVEFLMVNLTDGYRDTVEKAVAFVEDNGYTFPLYFDTEYSGATAYQVTSIPLSVFISADGQVAGTHLGAMNRDVLDQYIKSLLG